MHCGRIGSVYRRGSAGIGTGAEIAFLVIAFLYLISTAGGQLNPSTCLSSHIKCHCSDSTHLGANRLNKMKEQGVYNCDTDICHSLHSR